VSQGAPVDPHGLTGLARPKILFMRHPQTQANVSRVYLGRRNSPLSPLGLQQAAAAADALARWKPGKIVSSPLERCLAVARPAAQALGIEVEVDDRAVEFCFGELEGKTVQQAKELDIALPWDADGRWPCSGAEPLESAAARLRSLCDDLAQTECDVAVVTHGGMVRTLFAAVLGMPLPSIWQINVPNVSSTVFSAHKGRLYLESFGLTPQELAARSQGI